MGMNKLERKAYKDSNKHYLIKLAKREGITALDGRVLYEVLRSGEGEQKPQLSSVISVHYRGTLIDGSEFDTSHNNPYPETFRLREVIEGWQIALQRMVVGDLWRIYIPADKGYGKSSMDGIPGNSTLIFEVELLAIH